MNDFLRAWHGCSEHNHDHCPECRVCDCWGQTWLVIEPGTGWHGDNYRVVDLDTGSLVRIFATRADADAYVRAEVLR